MPPRKISAALAITTALLAASCGTGPKRSDDKRLVAIVTEFRASVEDSLAATPACVKWKDQLASLGVYRKAWDRMQFNPKYFSSRNATTNGLKQFALYPGTPENAREALKLLALIPHSVLETGSAEVDPMEIKTLIYKLERCSPDAAYELLNGTLTAIHSFGMEGSRDQAYQATLKYLKAESRELAPLEDTFHLASLLKSLKDFKMVPKNTGTEDSIDRLHSELSKVHTPVSPEPATFAKDLHQAHSFRERLAAILHRLY